MANRDSEHPNVLWLFTDQHRADTVNALGNSVIDTPSLNRLCREGTAFTKAYTPSPVCVPARCSMHYGQYPLNTGCYDNRYAEPQDGRRSIIEAMTEAGYRTHGIGKSHFSPDRLARGGHFHLRPRRISGGRQLRW